jgi:hypothetical protein
VTVDKGEGLLLIEPVRLFLLANLFSALAGRLEMNSQLLGHALYSGHDIRRSHILA